jgi:ectoine hydroxylase-related dioxygenase (phytanoyl-CoA dioxygenase family)
MSQQRRGRNNAISAATTAASVLGLLGTLYYLDIPALLRKRLESRKVEPRCYSNKQPPSLTAFKTLTKQITLKETYPLCSDIKQSIPIYNCNDFDLQDAEQLDKLQDELYHNLISGPGVYVMKHFFSNLVTIDQASAAFDAIIESELQATGAKGDHFAPASANSRIWNSFSKHALQDPESFAAYFSNPWFKVVCESYLGPGYRITSQVNIVRPGGQPQMPHRDYHLGFQTDEDVVAWPKAVHAMSGLLTLQGAVAHTNMPADSGPTRLMPYSQTFDEGYRSYRTKEFIDYFTQNYVAIPLEKGDALFFSPALFHAAGENCTEDFDRSANLIQVSSTFGKTMETIDTLPLIERTYEILFAKYKSEGMNSEVDALIRAVGDGYPFPTNLDSRPPAPGGMAPESEQDILRRGISSGWDKERLMEELTDMKEASSASGKITRQTTVFGT